MSLALILVHSSNRRQCLGNARKTPSPRPVTFWSMGEEQNWDILLLKVSCSSNASDLAMSQPLQRICRRYRITQLKRISSSMRKSESRVSSFGNAIFVKPKEYLSYDAAHYECAEVEQISAPEISRDQQICPLYEKQKVYPAHATEKQKRGKGGKECYVLTTSFNRLKYSTNEQVAITRGLSFGCSQTKSIQ